MRTLSLKTNNSGLSEKLLSSWSFLRLAMVQPWKDLGKVLVRPNAFFTVLKSDKVLITSIGFLFLVSLISSSLNLVLVSGIHGALFAIVFSNAFLTPLMTAMVLYLPVRVLGNGPYSLQALIAITSYAQAPQLFSWIPGMAWPLGLWKLWLMGIGLIYFGKIGRKYTLCCLFLAEGLMLLFFYLCRFLF